MESIALDVHRHCTVYTRVDEAGRIVAQERVANEVLPEVIGQIDPPCRAVLEATGNWGRIDTRHKKVRIDV